MKSIQRTEPKDPNLKPYNLVDTAMDEVLKRVELTESEAKIFNLAYATNRSTLRYQPNV
jgi:hypothetical protein